MDSADARGFTVVAWIIIISLAAVAVYEWLMRAGGGWQDVALLAGAAVAAAAILFIFNQLPTFVNLVLVSAVALNAFGYTWNLYQRWAWADKVIHAYTIFAITLALGVLAYGVVLTSYRNDVFWFILAVASFGIAVGAIWEIFEWAYDTWFAPQQNVVKGKWDTILDLIVDSIGALLGAWLAVGILPERPEEKAKWE